MTLLFSTENEAASNKFKRWKEFMIEFMGPARHFVPDELHFKAELEVGRTSYINHLLLSNSGIESIVSPGDINSKSHQDNLFVSIQIDGTSTYRQGDRVSERVSGEFTVLDNSPGLVKSNNENKNLILIIPRERLEKTLGPTKNYTTLTIGHTVTSGFMAVNYFHKLVTISERLDLVSADRLATIGVDLIVASIAERLAQDTPRSLHGTVVLQRAKAYIEDNLEDPNLNPPQLAAAVGVSLRRLQQLFQEQERGISDWIWQRRLELAAKRLADPGYAHRSIGQLAHSCGFIDQAHFSRRFKSHFGPTPGDYRWHALMKLESP